MSQGDASLPLITRYRPQTFSEVRGNQARVAALARRVGTPGQPHAYLFTGGSGTGKTTLARIVGATLNADIVEVDAASHTGVDAMRALVDSGYYLPPNAEARLVILDECHRLSRNAWDVALKMVEEPPEHLYLALCTTELSRVPRTIITRCYHVELEQLDNEEIQDFLLLDIMDREGWTEIVDPGVFNLVVREAGGSPRQALSLLGEVFDAKNVAEAQRIMSIHGPDNPLIQVLTVCMSGQGGWANIRPMLQGLETDDFTEGAIIEACRYVIGAMVKEEGEARARRMWEVLSALTYPAHGYDPKSLFIAAVGRVLWSEV